MKRILQTTLLFISLIAAIVTVTGQTTTTVCDGTTTNEYVPFMGYNADYNYTRSQMIYPASTLSDLYPGAQIESIKFYGSSAKNLTSDSWNVYISEVASTSISTYYDPATCTEVYSGTLSIVADGSNYIMTVSFTSPYTYNGGNLLIGFDQTLKGSYSREYWKGISSTGSSIGNYSSTSAAAAVATQRDFLPKLMLTYVQGTPPTCPRPTALAASNITSNSADLSWTLGGSETSWEIDYNGTTEVVTENPYALSGLTDNTDYMVRVRAICSETDTSDWSNAITFKTLCSALSVPYTQDFTDYDGTAYNTAGVMADCWNPIYYGTSAGYAPHIYEGGSYSPTSNDNCLYLGVGYYSGGSYFYGDKTYTIFPAFTDALNTLQVRFAYNMYNSNAAYAALTLGYMTDITDTSTYTIIANVPHVYYSNSRYNEFEYNITGTIPDGARLAFRYQATTISTYNSTYTFIDDIVVDIQPTCLKPTDLSVFNINTTSADVAWTANSGETSWEIDYNGTTEVVTENPYTLNVLTENTDYTVRVRAICSETDTSAWSGSITFTTLCDPVTLFPYTEDFASTSFPPDCWSQKRTEVGTGTSGTEYPYGAWARYTSTNGSNSTPQAQLRDTRQGSKHNLVTGALDFTYQGGYIISVDVYRNGGSSINVNEGIRVLVSSTPGIDGTTDTLGFIARNYSVQSAINGDIIGAESATGWYTYELPTGRTGINYIIFEGNSQYSSSTYMDNVIIKEKPTCQKPTDLATSNITSSTADLAWTVNSGESSWEIELNDTTFVVSENPYTLTDLTPNTNYTARVRAICSEADTSEWSDAVSFATLCESFVITDVNSFMEDFNDITSGIPSCWDNSEGTTTTESYKWNSYSSGFEGRGVRFNSYYNSTGLTNMLKTPVMDLSGASNVLLLFSYKNPAGGDYSVYLSTDGGATYPTALVTGLTGASSWMHASCVLPSGVGYENVVIVFRGTSNYGNGDAYLYLDNVVVRQRSTANDILTFSLPEQTNSAVIDNDAHTVNCEISFSADLTAQTPTITISDYATINPASGVTQDFTNPVSYIVTAEDNTTQEWIVTVTKAATASSANDIVSFTFANQINSAIIDTMNHTVNAVLDWQQSLTSVTPTITISDLATITPASGVAQDFTAPITYTVMAEDSTEQEWIVTIVSQPTPDGANCEHPYIIDFATQVPYYEEGFTNENFADDYNSTSLGNYDVGEDFIFQLVVDQTYEVTMTMTPDTTYTGFALFNGCPDTAAMIASVSNSGSTPRVITQVLEPGIYYLMCDIWTSPYLYNFSLEISANTCITPSQLTTSAVYPTSATIAWTSLAGETEWNVEYGVAGFTQGTGTILDVTTNPFIIDNLTANTDYDFYVQAVCSETDSSAWSNAGSFYTGSCTPAPISVDGDGITQVTFGYNQVVNNTSHPTSSPYYGNYTAQVGDGRQGTRVNVNITYATGYTYGTFVWVNWNNDCNFDDSEIVYYGMSESTNPTTLTASFIIPLGTPLGNYPMRIGGADLQFDTYESADPCLSSSFIIYEDYTLQVIEAPSCLVPENVIADNITNNTADITWQPGLDETAWQIEYGAAGFAHGAGIATEITDTTFYAFSGLTPNTDYDVYIRSICSESDSSGWSSIYSFTTLCDAITITESTPFLENFTDYTATAYNVAGVVPDCWNRIGTGSSSSYAPHVYAGSYSPNGNTNNALVFTSGSASYGNYNYAILPNFTNDLTTLTLSFCTSMESSTYGVLTFGYMTNFTDATTYTALDTVPNNYYYNNRKVDHEYILGHYNIPSGAMLAYRWSDNSTSFCRCAIDSVQLQITPSCIRPSYVAVDDIEGGDVTISWYQETGQDTWQIEYGEAGFDLGTGIRDTIWNNPFTIVGLNGATNYDVYVRAICSATDTSEWSSVVSFMTGCLGVVTITETDPYTEDFNQYAASTSISTDGVIPVCWNRIATGTNPGYAPHIFSGSYTPIANDNALVFTSGTSTYGSDNYAILAEFTNNLSDLQVLFSTAMESDDYGTLTLGYMTDVEDATTYTVLRTVPSNDVDDIRRVDHSYILASDIIPTGATLAFRWSASTSYWSCCIDNVMVRIAPTCLVPENVTATVSSSNSIDVSWTAVDPTQTTWNIEYGVAGFTQGTGIVVAVTANPYTITGLTADTYYDIYVQADCGNGDSSEWSNVITSYTGTCIPAPTDVDIEGAGITNITFGTGANIVNNATHQNSAPYYGDYTSQVGEVTAGDSVTLVMASDFSYYDYDYYEDYYYTYGTAVWVNWNSDVEFSNSELVAFDETVSGYTYSDLTLSFVVPASTPAGDYVLRLGAVYGWTQATADPCYSGDDGEVEDYTLRVIANTDCTTPTTVTVSAIDTSATISWTAGTETSWNIEYGPAGFAQSTGTTVVANTNPYTITGLTALTSYDVYVQAVCDDNVTSDWSTTQSFTTTSGIAQYSGLTTSVYPNPTTGEVNVRLSAYIANGEIAIYDVYGKLLKKVNVDGNVTTINVADLSDGVYFVRISDANAVLTTTKLVKK